MTKRIISLTLIILLLLPAAIAAGCFVVAPELPFAVFDKAWESSLSAALGGAKSDFGAVTPLPDGERYIVKFKDDTDLKTVEKALDGSFYNLLGTSESLLFAVVPEENGFAEKWADIIDYCEPDLTREAQATVNDPAVTPYYESLSLYSAWDKAKADGSIIVAVLDTGIDRTHEDLQNANILAGYDAVEGSSGVNNDTTGHGTGVIGLIAATANNGLGIAGVAHGVTVLPIKISSNGSSIYSSDLISGIRFAADSGAKIINMSLGGYSASLAEQEAVNYALSKGCILISAAGNGGNRPYADQKSYPASYEGVISVASCNELGERSEFSQYNDSVDVAAYGENLIIPCIEDGVSVYKTDSGTSFACALVSGIAALAASYIDEDVRFESEEFLSLIIESCGSHRSNELGYGIINADSIVSLANTPIISGVYNGGVYYDSVNIGFNRGTALLDGEPFNDGDAVLSNGKHTITVTDGSVSKTVNFRLDYDPLSFEFTEFSSFAYFKFERGFALLDGFPYKSGDRITASGRHEFVLTDGIETKQKAFELKYSLPVVYGIEKGGVYDKPVEIRVVGNGTAELDGNPVYGEIAVFENGKHSLVVKSGNGAISEEYSFEINFPYGVIGANDYSGANAAVDEEHGYACIYGESLVGVRIYDINSLDSFLFFLPTGTVYGHGFTEDSLLLFGENGITVIDRKNALNRENAVVKTVSLQGIVLYAFGGGAVYGFGSQSVYTIDIEAESADRYADLGFDCESVIYDDNRFCIVPESEGTAVYVFDIETKTTDILDIGLTVNETPIYFGNGYLAIKSRLIDTETQSIVLEYCSNRALKIENGLLFTENRIIDIATAEELGSFPFAVSDIIIGNERVYLFGEDSVFATIENSAEAIALYGGAERVDYAFGVTEDVNEYRVNLYFDKYSNPISSVMGGKYIFALFDGRNALYGFNFEVREEITPIQLLYKPDNIYISQGCIAVTFETASKIYFAREDDIENGIYIDFTDKCGSVFVLNDRIHAVCNNKIVYCNLDGGGINVTDINAEQAVFNGEIIYTEYNRQITAYHTNFAVVNSVEASNGSLFAGNAVAVGNKLFTKLLDGEYKPLKYQVVAFSGNTAITKDGVYDLKIQDYIGNTGIKNPKIAVIGENNHVLAFGNGIVSVSFCAEGDEVTSSTEIEGIANGEIYLDSVTVNHTHGTGFLDGMPFESGGKITEAGNHTYLVSLPCGRSIAIEFTIEALVGGIEFLVPQRTVSVGESLTLRIKYLPDGAASVPVKFHCDSEDIIITDGGELTALKTGEYTVTAVAETEYGVFNAECVITVRDDIIAFNPESGIRIDRDNGIVLGIPAGTSVSQLVKLLYNTDGISVLDQNGKKASGIIGTGYSIVLYKNGAVNDRLKISIRGDTDGDGYISAFDLYILKRILRGYSYEAEFIASGDIDANGILGDSDYRVLERILLNRTQYSIPTPPKAYFGTCGIQTVSSVRNGDIIDVAICLSGCKYALAVSGNISFGDGLEFIDAESVGWENDIYVSDNKVNFYSYSNDGEYCSKAFFVVLNLKFRVIGNENEKIHISGGDVSVKFTDGTRRVSLQPKEFDIKPTQNGEFKIEISNAEGFTFKEKVFEYDVKIPYNSALADISVIHPEGDSVSVSGAVVGQSGKTVITVTHNRKNGSSKNYTLNVMREKEPDFDTNCRLSALEIEGVHLSPSFNPNVLEYSVSVPCGTSKINVYCTAQNEQAEIIVSDTTVNEDGATVYITVAALDGETLVYTINVSVLPEESEATDSSDDVPDDTQSGNWEVIALIFVVVLLGLSCYIYFTHGSQKEENQQ